MRVSSMRLWVAIFLLCTHAGLCQAITVLGTANIFGAGHGTPPAPGGGGGGTLPPSTAFAGASYVEFTSVTGLVNCCSSAPNTGPDGAVAGTNINSTGGISGILAPRQMMLVGVFLDASEPAGAGPARLDFGSIGLSFATLSPLLGQTFYIGDGLTGTGSGSLQRFYAPTGATRLFLGIADSFGFGGDPGWYADNTGAFDVDLTVTPVPEPATAVLALAALGGVLRRRIKA